MTYRTGNHWGVTIVREGSPGATYGEPGGDPGEDELVAVVVNGDQALAQRICRLLNADEPCGTTGLYGSPDNPQTWICRRKKHGPIGHEWELATEGEVSASISPQAAETGPAVPASTPGPSEAECGCPVTYQRCRIIDHTAACSTRRSAERIARDLDWVTDEPADSCTCTIARTDPACPVHHGRRARGPKPANPPGCICDGSGRTCPRHGAVL